MKLLVTGATGYIGRACLGPLQGPGVELHAVARHPVDDLAGVPFHACDLLDRQQVTRLLETVRPTHLLHLAWIATPGVYWTSPDNDAWHAASVHLLESFLRLGGERAVLSGTCAEYDWSAGVCSEASTPLKGESNYARAKIATWRHVEAAIGRGASVAWPRIFWSFGPHEPATRLVPSVILALLSGQRASCSSASLQRDFLPVEAVGQAMAALVRCDVRGAVNIGSGRATALGRLVALIAQKLGRSSDVDLTDEQAAGQASRVVADTRRLETEIGHCPQLDLDTAISRTIDWWRQLV